MNRKTALILSTSGMLVAAAVILGQRGSQATTVTAPTAPTSVASPSPVPVVDACSAEPAPATHVADFAHGTLRAALSSQKLLHGSTGEMFVAIDLSARDAEAAQRPPMSLAVVIDRSGSMAGDKLVQAKQAAEGLIERLSVRDRVALVQYDDGAQVILPITNMDTAGKARAHAAIRRIMDGGGTNLHDGLALGRDELLATPMAGALDRVILLSDGQANAGITDLPTLSGVAGTAADRGIRITTVGLGVDYNEELMEALAEHGRGHYYYVQQAGDLQSIFRGELDSIQATVARNTELQLDPACPGVEVLEVYGFNSERAGSGVTIPMADLFGGDERRIVARLRVPAGAQGARNALRVTLRYDDAKAGTPHTAAVALGVDISTDERAVELSSNKDVITEVVKVQGAQALRAAASAYQRGDVAQAESINRGWRDQAVKQAAAYDLEESEMAPMLGELDGQAQEMRSYAPGSSEGKAMIKASKSKARMMSKQKR